MANTTIEDVLDRNGIGGAHWSYRNSVIAAMQEYASLQTPSNENYWKQRCELSELMYSKLTMSEYHGEIYEEWEKLREQTPSPTGDRDCEELKKEVERLKGEGDWAYILKLETEIERRYDLIKELFGGIGIGNEKSEKEWQQFKTENNI